MAAPAIPAGVQLATIAWLWTAAIGNETTVPADLTVTFDPAPEWLQYTAAAPHMTIAPWSVPATIGPDGTLLGPDGTANVTLLPTDDTDLNPSAWTYQVTVRQGPRILMDFPIAAPGGVTTDLATVTPIAGSTGNAVIVGPIGPPNTLTAGTATTGAPGTDMSFTITGEAPNQVLNLTIPRGDAGNPTAYELRGAGSPYGAITPAAAGIYYTDTAATNGAIRWVSTGTTNTSWIVTVGDTGWRNISASITASGKWTLGGSDQCVMRRVGSAVHIIVAPVKSSSTGQAKEMPWPFGFAKTPIGPQFYALYNQSNASSVIGWINTHDTGLFLGAMQTAAAMLGTSMHFTADPWPTTLPGTPA